ncbi:MAG: DUF1570 domain-containing protein [Planctomycetota bacterium]|jgi:hypothetical protein
MFLKNQAIRSKYPLRLTAVLSAALLITVTTAETAESKYSRRKRVEEAARVKDYPKTSWSNAVIVTSKNNLYQVRTNTSKATASYIAKLMEYVSKNFRNVFNYYEPMPKLKICAYRTMKEYNSVIEKVAPDMKGSSGLFLDRKGKNTIHLPYIMHSESSPTTVLLHEGTHQFITNAFGYRIPEQYLPYFPEDMKVLASVPLWLNEGLATYMEVSYYNGEKLVVGEINKGRLLQLQHEIKDGKFVTIKELLTTPQSKFKSSHYASAWGLVYWLMNDDDDEKFRIKREILKDYLKDCKKGFMTGPDSDFKDKFLQSPDTFQDLWGNHVIANSYKQFLRRTIGLKHSKERWQKWENSWKKWILRLTHNLPNGGLRKRN